LETVLEGKSGAVNPGRVTATLSIDKKSRLIYVPRQLCDVTMFFEFFKRRLTVVYNYLKKTQLLTNKNMHPKPTIILFAL